MIDGPNAEQVKYWNETAGAKWVAYQEVLDRQIGPLGIGAMDRARVALGERVIDVGCGCGATTLELGRRVGSGGRVLGVDISAPMLGRAAERARDAGAEHVRFANADAQTFEFPPAGADLVFSRFGVMFFIDPVAAFGNLRRALASGGRLAFICWQPIWENPWLLAPLQAAAELVTLPPPPAPGAPGPFSLGDPDRLREVLAGAGFATPTLHDERRHLSVGGGSLAEAVDLLMGGVGPLSAVLREADPAVIPRVRDAVRNALAPFVVDGAVRMPSASWIVTAAAAT